MKSITFMHALENNTISHKVDILFYREYIKEVCVFSIK